MVNIFTYYDDCLHNLDWYPCKNLYDCSDAQRTAVQAGWGINSSCFAKTVGSAALSILNHPTTTIVTSGLLLTYLFYKTLTKCQLKLGKRTHDFSQQGLIITKDEGKENVRRADQLNLIIVGGERLFTTTQRYALARSISGILLSFATTKVFKTYLPSAISFNYLSTIALAAICSRELKNCCKKADDDSLNDSGEQDLVFTSKNIENVRSRFQTHLTQG